MKNFLLILLAVLKQSWNVIVLLLLYGFYKAFKMGKKKTISALLDVKNYLLFLAYFLKLVGLGVGIYFILAFLVFGSDSGTMSENLTYLFTHLEDKDNLFFLITIIVSAIMFSIGSIWSKKLLKK